MYELLLLQRRRLFVQQNVALHISHNNKQILKYVMRCDVEHGVNEFGDSLHSHGDAEILLD